MNAEDYGEIDEERAAEYRDVMVAALNAHMNGVPADGHDVLNGIINAGCMLISQGDDEDVRVHMVAEAIRLLLQGSNVNAADVQARMAELSMVFALADAQPAGRA